MRVNRFQQRLREAREFRVHLDVDARGQKREPFQQPLHERVRAGVDALCVQREASSDLRELARKLRRRVTQVAQLIVVMMEKRRSTALGGMLKDALPVLEIDLRPDVKLLRQRRRP